MYLPVLPRLKDFTSYNELTIQPTAGPAVVAHHDRVAVCAPRGPSWQGTWPFTYLMLDEVNKNNANESDLSDAFGMPECGFLAKQPHTSLTLDCRQVVCT